MLQSDSPTWPVVSLKRAAAWLSATLILLVLAFPSAAQTANPRVDAQTLSRLQEVADDAGQVRILVGRSDRRVGRGSARSQQHRAFRDGVLARLGSLRHRVRRSYSEFPLLSVEVSREALDALASDSEVDFIEPVVAHRPTLSSSLSVIGAPTVHTEGTQGAGTTVAIIDTGVDNSHAAFGGRVIPGAERCFSSFGTLSGGATVAALCPNGTSGEDAGLHCSQLSLGCDHGTHVAGIAAGSGGVAPLADIIAIQVFSLVTDSATCSGATCTCGSPGSQCILAFSDDIIAGLNHVLALRIAGEPVAAVNMSLGGGSFTSAAACDAGRSATKVVIDNLRAAGVLAAISSGNSGNASAMGGPGCISTAISVGSSTDGDNVSGFSNTASWMDVFAPGSSITAPVPGGQGTKSGTSMAAPHVAGMLALLRSEDSTLTADELEAILRTKGVDITHPSSGFKIPRIDAIAMVDATDSELSRPANVILDEDFAPTELALTGSFTSFGDPRAYNGEVLIGAAGATARYTPVLPHPGLYRVHAFWPADAADSSSTDFTVQHAGGTAQFNVDQTTNGATWQELGTFQFLANGTEFVELTAIGAGLAVDGVRFEHLQRAPLVIETTTLPDATVGSAYNAALAGAGGQGALSWQTIAGALPGGLTLSSGGTISGTPSAAGTFNFTVELSDSDVVPSTASVALALMVVDDGNNDPLLDESFAGGDLSLWEVTDNGTKLGPAAWAIDAGLVRQSANVYGGSLSGSSIPKPGTTLHYIPGLTWTDYDVESTFRSTDDDGIGYLFRRTDANNWYRFSWDRQRNYRRLVKSVNGTVTLLASDSVPYATGQTYDARITAVGDELEVFIDGQLIFSVTDTSHSAGTVAFYSWGNQTSEFHDITVNPVGPGGANAAPVITAITATPPNILDTQTSQLSVTATDESQLTYAWSVAPGEGSLAGENTATPVYTPPDIAGSQSFEVSVTVSDGEKSTVGSVFIGVTDPNTSTLLSEDFASGDLSGWEVTDNGTKLGPPNWSAPSGELVQSANVYGGSLDGGVIAKPGTTLHYLAGQNWADYEASFTMRSDDDDGLGVLFRRSDADNWYRFSWDRQRNYRRLVKSVAGVVTLLAEDAVPYNQGQTYDVRVRASGPQLEVFVDNVLVFSAVDVDHASGTIAFYSWGNQGSRFDDVTVQAAGAAGGPPIISSVTATPSSINDLQTSQLAVTATDPDNPPVALTYLWTVAPGGGSFGDPTSATPVYTPPDVSSAQAFVISVTVSDADSESTDSVTVSVSDAASPQLLSEDFSTGDLSQWELTDSTSKLGPPAWSAATGVLVQSANAWGGSLSGSSVPKPGTTLHYLPGQGWTNYALEVSIRSTDDDGIGMEFRRTDSDNYYRFSWDRQRSYRRLVKNVNGVVTLLAADSVVYNVNQTYALRVVANGDQIDVFIDGAPVFSVTDSSHPSGTISAYSWGNDGAEFDDIVVTAE